MTFKEADKILREIHDYDYSLESYRTPQFWEIVTSTGGDIVTYRVYDNGEVYCK